MSLIEPLLPVVEDQKINKTYNDPLANFEKSIEDLSAEYESFEFDGASDMNVLSGYLSAKFKNDSYESNDIKCTATFENKLIIGRIDGIIKIYDLENKEEIVLKGHTNEVNCLQICASQDFLISGSSDKKIIIWNLKNHTQETVFKEAGKVFCLVVDFNYNLFSVSENEKIVRKWNISDKNQAKTLACHNDDITCMKISHNNAFLATGSKDCSLITWEIQSSQVFNVLNGHQGWINEIEFTENDEYIVSESRDFQIIIWNFYKREMIKRIEESYEKDILKGIFISQNECIWIKANKQEEGLIQAYNIKSGETRTLNQYIEVVTYSKVANLLYYRGFDDSIQIFDLKTFQSVPFLNNFESRIYNLLIVGNRDKYLASIMENGKIKIHKINKVKLQEEFSIKFPTKEEHQLLTRCGKYLLQFSLELLKIWSFAEKKYVFSIDKNIILLNKEISFDDKYFMFINKKDSTLYVYSFQDMKEVANFDVEILSTDYCFSISKDSRFIVAGMLDGTIEIFDIENKSKASSIEGGKSEILSLQLNISLELSSSANQEKSSIVWNRKKRKEKDLSLKKENDFLKISAKNNCLIVGFENLVQIWNFQEKRKIAEILEETSPISCIEITDDESYLIFAQGNKVTLWSFEHMKEVDSVISDDYITSIDVTRDNKYMIIVHRDIPTKLWSCKEKIFITAFESLELRMWYQNFSSDCKSIIYYNYNDKEAKILNIEDYLDYSKIDSYPYFVCCGYSTLLIKKFLDWIKKPCKELYDESLHKVVVYPIRYNILHFLCMTDNVFLLSAALKDGAEIFRDKQNMSPLSYALIKSSRRCIDETLNYVIKIEDDRKMLSCIHQLRDDIPLLFETKSQSLVPFLEVLFRRRADRDVIGFYEITRELPMSIFSPISKIYTSAFTEENNIMNKDSTKQKESLVQFWGSAFGYNYTAGSEESLLLLKKMDECENQQIFKTLFVQAIIKEKWDYLWPAIITISVIFWLNLITMVWHMFDPSIYILSSFVVLNGILAIYELLQIITNPIDYISVMWNLIDSIRVALSIIWAIFQFYDENINGLSFAVVLFSFFRGLTCFRVFDFTRLYVRLVLMAFSDSFAFLIIFLYTTLAFAILYASLDINLSFSGVWAMAYELNMGNFENNGLSFLQYSCFTLASLINVVVMLNLLVSTLGDTFDKFQMIVDELDSKEMLQLVLEFESMMFWARSEQAKLRNKGKLMYLQRCDIFQDGDGSDKWQGKIKEISLKIDGVKNDVFDNKKNVTEEIKKLEENIEGSFERIIDEKVMRSQEYMNAKIFALEGKVDYVMGMLISIKEKLQA